MTKESKLFTQNTSKPIFKIEIDVFENCQTMKVIPAEGENTSYQAIIGALEIQKLSMWVEQSTANMEKWIAVKKESKIKQTP
jgi:hypothetical protein